MPSKSDNTESQTQIGKLIEDLSEAIRAKDVNRIMNHYARDVVVFNVRPPFRTVGSDSWRHTWEESLAHFPDSFDIEAKDVNIVVDGDLGVVHRLWRATWTAPNPPSPSIWLRNTIVYKRNQERWEIVHEHWSVPFDPETSRAVFDAEV